MIQSPALAALVVTMNRPDQIRQTVARLRSEGADYLVIVDNGSDADTRDWLRSLEDDQTRILLTERNLGGAGGFARALTEAREAFDPDWYLLMDDDARPDPGALAAFRAMDKTGWDALAAAAYYPDGTICEMNRPLVNRLSGPGFIPAHLTPEDYASPYTRPVAASSFVGLFLTRTAVRTIGLPDPDLFLYMEDGLYTLALTRAGLRLGFAPKLRFTHDCQTLATRTSGFRPVWKAYYYHRNLLIFYRRAMGPLVWPTLAYLIPRWLMKTRDQKGEARAFLRYLARAIRDGLRGRTGTGPVENGEV
ncbi:glycosyltransferase [Shimia aestuarii]|uniref:glycosyltransferase n=1 Tax=Shimia aestuarii TaxID=254406 RepID=UPI001FB1C676|nr:glycosyltransferase [Shimia aestuarii]